MALHATASPCTTMTTNTRDVQVLATGPAPTASIIVLHGLGADGNDFVPICDELDLSAVGPVRYVFPHAPVRPVTLNGGMPMRAWYDILGPGGKFGEDEPGLRQSAAAVQALLDREAARGIAPARTVLMGFSQGCAMTLLAGLRAPQRLAGLVGLSGYLPLLGATATERHDVAGRELQIRRQAPFGHRDDVLGQHLVMNVAAREQLRQRMTDHFADAQLALVGTGGFCGFCHGSRSPGSDRMDGR